MTIFEFLRFLNGAGFKVRPKIPDIKYGKDGLVNYVCRQYEVSDCKQTYDMFAIHQIVHYPSEPEPEPFLDFYVSLFGQHCSSFDDLHAIICGEIIEKIMND